MFQKNSTKTDKMRAKAEAPPPAPVSPRKVPPTIIASDVRILGNLLSDTMCDINGRVEGNVTADTVYIRDEGMITGDITASTEIHIFGAVHGVIKSPKVFIYATAHIEGAIMHQTITIEEGAYVDAQFKPVDAHVQLGEAPQPAPSAHHNDSDNTSPHDEQEVDEDYDMLKDLKLIN